MNIFIKRLLVFLIPLTALLALQCFVDPYDLYSWQFITAINPNARQEKVHNYLNSTGRDFDTIVLGSSRSMRLYFGENSYNFGVEDARAEDIYCIFRFILDHCSTQPKRVFLGIDPEFFHNSHPSSLQLLNERPLEKYLVYNIIETTVVRSDFVVKTSRSIVASFILLYDLFRGIAKEQNFIETTGIPRDEVPHQYLRDAHPDFTKRYRARFESFSHLDQGRLSYFEHFINLCSLNDIEIIGFVTSLHPQLDYILDLQGIYPARMREMFAYFDTIEYPLFTYYDFSTPNKFDGDDYDFFDPAHIGDYNAELLVERLLELIEE